ncbi:MAG: hypothetical protein HN712_21175 [Gemmatimonadetes bacterium]|nr:hypothetical protein [Gemmatimonadota bacterium]MBT6147302.1 hypothetical protein [Gemmatimonadota bacterium]MBT7862841.1 hypothetical protein [Gemmatimonadota bacterium]
MKILPWVGLFMGLGLLTHMPASAQSAQIEPSALARVPLGNVGEGLYWQQLRITLGHDDEASSEAIRIGLPAVLALHDADGDGALFDEVRVVYRAVDFELPRFEAATATSANVIVLSTQSAAAAGGQVYIQFPCQTTATPSGSFSQYGPIEFADARESDLSGTQAPVVQFVDVGDLQASGSMGIVDLAAPLSSGADTLTSARGTVYPASPSVLVLDLPDLVFDGGQAHPNRRAGHGDGDDANDTPYRFFFATQGDLTGVGADVATEARIVSDETVYGETEGTGSPTQLLTRDLPADTYWLYVVSDVTGRIPLGRSRALQIRHQPVIERLGPIVGNSLAEDAIVFDSGGLLNLAGVADGDGPRRLVIDLETVDHDDAARVHLFYGSDPNLGPADVLFTDVSTVSLNGATAITTPGGLSEETRRFDWSTTSPVVPEGDYYVYAVAAGGTEANVDRSDHQVLVRHAPFLRLDDLDDLTSGQSILTGGRRPQRYLTLGWGLSGTDGDADADDAATIALYLSPSADHAVPGGSAAIQLDADAFLIANGLSEDEDERESNQFVWDLWSLAEGSFVPVAGQDYYLYGTIDDGDLSRLTRMGDGAQPTVLRFEHPPALRPMQPSTPITIGAGQSARVSWQDMDLDTDARLRIVLSAEDHGDTTNYSNVVSGLAYVINSTDGFALTAVDVEADLSEDDSTDTYDLRTDHLQRGPNTSSAPQPGTYHVYLSITDTGTFGTETRAWRAPGTLTLSGPATQPTRKVFSLLPENFTIGTGGDPQRVDVVVDAFDQTVDLVLITLRLDAAIFDVVDQDPLREGVQPFSVRPGFSDSKLVTNSAVVTSDGSLVLTCEYFDPAPAGMPTLAGDRALVAMEVFAVAGEGTSELELLSDPGQDQPSQLERNGAIVVTPSAQPLATARLIQGRGTVDGRISLEGRLDQSTNIDVAWRHWGSFLDIEDDLFAVSNDVDPDRAGVQVPVQADGSFQVSQAPTGRLDLHVRHDGYLEGRVAGLEIHPGGILTSIRPTTIVGDTLLLGGDVAGYLNPAGVSIPDNEVTLADWDFVASLFDRPLDEAPDSVRADITGDGAINIRDLTLVGANYLRRGPAPVYRRAVQRQPIRVELSLSGSQIAAGDTLEATLVATSWFGVRSAEAALGYDPAHWSLVDVATVDRALVAQRHHDWGSRWGVTRLGTGDLNEGDSPLRWRWVARVEAPEAPRIADILLLDAQHLMVPLETGVVSAIQGDVSLPVDFGLRSNYPNPFNPATTIRFDVPAAAGDRVGVSLDIYNAMGQRLIRLVQEALPAGRHVVTWNGRDRHGQRVASGVYYAHLRAGLEIETRPMLLLK